jgi:hypothetical protein
MIAFNDEPSGPSFETLMGLRKQIKSFVKTKKKQLAKEKQMATGTETRDTKCCKVCCTTFDKKLVSLDAPLEAGVCKDCQKVLDEGYIGIIHGNEYAFIKPASDKFKDLAGTVIHVCQDTFEEAKRQLNAKKPQPPGLPG